MYFLGTDRVFDVKSTFSFFAYNTGMESIV